MSETFQFNLTEDLVRRLFDQIEEYKHLEIKDIDILRQGMIYMSNQKLNDEWWTPWTVFVENLIKAAVEAGSKGIKQKA